MDGRRRSSRWYCASRCCSCRSSASITSGSSSSRSSASPSSSRSCAVIDRQRLRAALRQRRVAVVDEVGDVAEQQRRRRTATARRESTVDDADGARADLPQRVDERRHVEEVAQALAVGFEQRGKRPEACGDRQQVGGALALLPERRACARPPPRQQQRARRRSRGTAPRTARVAPSWRSTSASTSSGVAAAAARVRRRVGIREAHDEPIVAPQHLDVDAGFLADARGGGHRPRRVHPAAERRQHAHAPVAELVAAALDRRSCGRRARPAGRRLVGAGTAAGSRRRADRDRARRTSRSIAAAGGRPRSSRTSAPMASPSSSGRAWPVALPERHLPRLARRRGDEHAVVRDLLDAPASMRRA